MSNAFGIDVLGPPATRGSLGQGGLHQRGPCSRIPDTARARGPCGRFLAEITRRAHGRCVLLLFAAAEWEPRTHVALECQYDFQCRMRNTRLGGAARRAALRPLCSRVEAQSDL